MFFTLRNIYIYIYIYKNYSPKGSLGNQKRFFYGVVAKPLFYKSLFLIIEVTVKKYVQNHTNVLILDPISYYFLYMVVTLVIHLIVLQHSLLTADPIKEANLRLR